MKFFINLEIDNLIVVDKGGLKYSFTLSVMKELHGSLADFINFYNRRGTMEDYRPSDNDLSSHTEIF